MINHNSTKQPGAHTAALAAAAIACAPAGAEPVSSLAFDRLENNLGKEAALEVLQSFVAFVCDTLVELRQCLLRQNAAQARNVLRELRSSCSIMGAQQLHKYCALLDAALAAPDREKIELCMSNLRDEGVTLSRLAREISH